jgi:propionate CoA-transferase
LTLTTEAGAVGGTPLSGLDFGTSLNLTALLDQSSQFDFYDGGGADVAFLGMGQADQLGNVNVSLLGGRLTGCGGFINISQNSKKVVFMGTFTAGGLVYSITPDGVLRIEQEGRESKFVTRVDHVTFSAKQAVLQNKEVLYITERCVFRLTNDGLLLTEIAPGMKRCSKWVVQQVTSSNNRC